MCQFWFRKSVSSRKFGEVPKNRNHGAPKAMLRLGSVWGAPLKGFHAKQCIPRRKLTKDIGLSTLENVRFPFEAPSEKGRHSISGRAHITMEFTGDMLARLGPRMISPQLVLDWWLGFPSINEEKGLKSKSGLPEGRKNGGNKKRRPKAKELPRGSAQPQRSWAIPSASVMIQKGFQFPGGKKT